MARMTTEERFWSKVDIRGPLDCWEWRAGCNGNGYGTFTYRGKSWLAHRMAYMLHHGYLSKKSNVLHHCDNPACCNPAHHFLGTHQDNAYDAMEKGLLEGSLDSLDINHHPALTPEQVEWILAQPRPGRGRKQWMIDMARELGVGKTTVENVVYRRCRVEIGGRRIWVTRR
jgi:hypothetical protein